MALNQQPYTSQILAGGESNGREAAGTDFGAGVAQGIGAIGQGLGEDGRVLNQIDQDQGRVWAGASVPQKELAVRQTYTAARNALDPSAADYPQKISELASGMQAQVAQAQQELMDSAPTKSARKFVAWHMASAGLRLNDMAMQDQAKLNADYTTGLVNQGIKADTDLIAASPDNDTFARVLQKQHDSIAGLTTIGPDVKAGLINNVQHQYSQAQAFSAMSMNPQGFLTSINLQGGVTRQNGAQVGGVPGQAPGDPGAGGAAPDGSTTATQNPAMLAFANAQLASGMKPDEAMSAATQKFKPAAGVDVVLAADGKSFIDKGTAPTSQDPQVQPMTEQAIAAGQPPLAGWKNLGFGEKVQLVRQAEGLVGKTLASNRGMGTVQFQDAMASFAAGKDYPDVEKLKAQNLAVLSPDEAARKNDALDTGRQFAGFKAQVATMPDDQAAAWINQHKPEGGDEFAVKEPWYKLELAALASAQQDRRTKPTDYAVNNGIANAQPLDLSAPDKFGAGLRQRVAVNATMQRDYGAPPSIFTSAEVPQVTQALDKLSSHDAVGYLGSMAQSLGNTRDYQTAMSQLGQKNPMLAYVGNIAQTGAQVVVNGKPTAATDIAATALDGIRILDKQFDTAKGNDVPMPSGANAVKINENQFSAAFERALPATAFQSPNAAQAASQQKDIFNAVKGYYVSQAYHQGKPLDQVDPKDVQNAVDAITGGVVKQSGGALMVPYGMKTEDFQSQWNSRRDAALLAAGHSQEDVDRTGGNLLPINAGNGKYRFMNGTNLLVDPHNGQPVTVDYSKPAPAAAAQPPKLGDIPSQYQQAPY